MATPAAGNPEKYSFLPIRLPNGTTMFVFGFYLRRHPLDNPPKTRMLGHQEASSSSGPSKGVRYAGLLSQVPDQAGDAQRSTDSPQERAPRHQGGVSRLRHQDVQDRQGIGPRQVPRAPVPRRSPHSPRRTRPPSPWKRSPLPFPRTTEILCQASACAGLAPL